jgi:2-phosphosulfolactate phosphatase
VVIDVFRAFSCQPLFFHFGANKVILEADPDAALELKRMYPEFILVGEINEVPIRGAELGNSPTEILRKGGSFFKNKTVIHRTTAGVTGVTAAASRADEVILGSFVMAKAVAAYVTAKAPPLVTLVAMGDRAKKPAPEDEACADYIEHLITGKAYDHLQALHDVVFQPTAQKFIQRTKDYLPGEDPLFCLQRDLFDFVLSARRDQNLITVQKIAAT